MLIHVGRSRLEHERSENECAVRCTGLVVDWDRIDEHVVEEEIPKCDVILGAEVTPVPSRACPRGAVGWSQKLQLNGNLNMLVKTGHVGPPASKRAMHVTGFGTCWMRSP